MSWLISLRTSKALCLAVSLCLSPSPSSFFCLSSDEESVQSLTDHLRFTNLSTALSSSASAPGTITNVAAAAASFARHLESSESTGLIDALGYSKSFSLSFRLTSSSFLPDSTILIRPALCSRLHQWKAMPLFTLVSVSLSTRSIPSAHLFSLSSQCRRVFPSLLFPTSSHPNLPSPLRPLSSRNR